MSNIKQKINICSLVVSVLIAGGIVCGVLVYNRMWLSAEIQNPLELLGYVLAFLIGSALLYFLSCFVFSHFEKNALKKAASPQDGETFGIGALSDFKSYFIFLCVCWLPYLLIRFPGNYDVDTCGQLLQTHGLDVLSNHHPWFDTLLFGFFWGIGDICANHAISLLLYALFQIALTSAALAVLLCYISFLGMPEKHVRICKFLFAFYPVIPLFAQTMAKDMLFAPLFVLFSVLFCEICRTRGRCTSSTKFKLFFIVVCLLMMLTKKTGVYIAILSFIPLLFISCKKSLPLLLTILVIPLSLFLIWDKGIVPAMGVIQGSSAEMMSVPSQQSAFYLKSHQEEMSTSDWEVLQGVFNSPETMAQSFDLGRADAAKAHWKSDSSMQQKLDFAKWYVNAFFHDPKPFISAVLCLTLPIYSLDTHTEDDESLLFYRDNLDAVNASDKWVETTLPTWANEDVELWQIQELMSGAYRQPIFAKISHVFNSYYLKIMKILAPLFSKCLFAWWIPLAIIALLFRTKRAHNLVAMTPFFIMFLTLIAGPICLPRYMVAFIYVAPLLYGLAFMKMDLKEQVKYGEHHTRVDDVAPADAIAPVDNAADASAVSPASDSANVGTGACGGTS